MISYFGFNFDRKSTFYLIFSLVQPIMETVKESEESGTGEVESNNSAER